MGPYAVTFAVTRLFVVVVAIDPIVRYSTMINLMTNPLVLLALAALGGHPEPAAHAHGQLSQSLLAGIWLQYARLEHVGPETRVFNDKDKDHEGNCHLSSQCLLALRWSGLHM